MTGGETVAWRALLAEAAERLAEAGLPSAGTDARRLVECASGVDGAELMTVLDDPASLRGAAQLDRMLARRLDGEPLQYVVGSWSFRTLDLFVDRRVLIPRPETEVVVDHALAELDRQGLTRRALMVDLGTGSGAIAFAIACERSDVDVWATDASAPALDVARANLGGIGRAATRVRLVSGEWFDALPRSLLGRVDLIVSNPPYVADGEALPDEVGDWEPREALRAGVLGTEALSAIISEAPRWLASGASVVLELAPHHADEMAKAATDAGLVGVKIEHDLTGRDRVLIGRAPERDTH